MGFEIFQVWWKDGPRRQGLALGFCFQLVALSFITSQNALYGMGGFPSLVLSWSVLGVWGKDPASWRSC